MENCRSGTGSVWYVILVGIGFFRNQMHPERFLSRRESKKNPLPHGRGSLWAIHHYSGCVSDACDDNDPCFYRDGTPFKTVSVVDAASVGSDAPVCDSF